MKDIKDMVKETVEQLRNFLDIDPDTMKKAMLAAMATEKVKPLWTEKVGKNNTPESHKR